VASSLGKVKAQCLPFPARNAKVKDLIDLVGEEVQAVLDTVWRLNNNFIVLAIEGVLNMLNDTGYQELSQLCGLATSSDAFIVENTPNDVRRLAGRLVQKWWKSHGLPEALRRLEAGGAETVGGANVLK
jgi:hypothetical protein